MSPDHDRRRRPYMRPLIESLFLVVPFAIYCLNLPSEFPAFAEDALASCVLGTCATE